MSRIGDRAEAAQEQSAQRAGANNQLKALIERIERLEEEKQTIADDIKEVYAEGKGNGFDVKALRAIIKRRKADPQALVAFESILETYMNALGML